MNKKKAKKKSSEDASWPSLKKNHKKKEKRKKLLLSYKDKRNQRRPFGHEFSLQAQKLWRMSNTSWR
ncbi:hypothetical protein SLEP1_g42737 [Rubroshorea leprosula]|uniref:Ribosomal protein S14 n=1 Tax=Rubroshorea leprosula TaxID=152421 RepID=A0AAV5LAU3_9ROSI|nr:hypothetical protein SLEP1_g42737 [Rubroshorea leprosula]